MPADGVAKAELAKTNGPLECLTKTVLFTLVQEQTYVDQLAGDAQFKRRSRTAPEQIRNRTSESQEEQPPSSRIKPRQVGSTRLQRRGTRGEGLPEPICPQLPCRIDKEKETSCGFLETPFYLIAPVLLCSRVLVARVVSYCHFHMTHSHA